MGFAYVEAQHTDLRLIRWTCDTYGCRATEDEPDSGNQVKYLMPPEWSGVLVTSMSDGDYAYILCPTHTRDLHRKFNDSTDLQHNLQAVGN